MLNKIANIDSAKGYKSTKRQASAGAYERYLHNFAENKEIHGDSVEFSPAAVFLASVNWKLAEISYPSENEIAMDFYIDDIHFFINLDFTTFYKTIYQKVTLNKVVNGLEGKQKQTVSLLVAKPPIRIFEKYAKFSVDGIQTMFKRIKKMRLFGQINRYETFTISMLTDGIEDEIYKDFTNIFNVIYSFISKLGKFGINKTVQVPQNENEKIIFEKITVNNV